MFKTPASEFVYYRTYARWLEDKKRRENWTETTDRVINFLREERGHLVPDKVFNKIRENMLSFNVMPSMRLVWSAGEAASKDNTVIYNCSFLTVDSLKSFSECLHILCCGTGVGFSVENKYVSKLPKVSLLKTHLPPENFIIEDSKEGWADSIYFLMKNMYDGILVNFDYSKIRPKGSKLKTMGGRASGPEPLILLHGFIKDTLISAQNRQLTSLECHDIMNKIAEIVVVGGVRRSSQISLSDLNDIQMRDAKNWPFPLHRAMANNSAVYYDKPKAVDFLKEWSSLASSGTGERGICNLGIAQQFAPDRRKGELIAGFNPCVTGDTEILTDKGYVQIQNVIDTNVNIWNGFEWSEVEPKITGYNRKILNVKFSDGRELKCTPNHKFHLSRGYQGQTEVVEAIDLKIGDKLIKHDFPIITEGKEYNLDQMYTQGFYSADGIKNSKNIPLYCEKRNLSQYLLGNLSDAISVNQFGTERQILTLNFKPENKEYVPLEANLQSRLSWLAGLLDGDGCELKEGGTQVSSIDYKFLLNVQKLLSICGVNSKIVKGMEEAYRDLPDGKGGYTKYLCKEFNRICVGAKQIQDLINLGLNCKRLKFEKAPNRDASRFNQVIGIEDIGEVDKVYCFTEPKRNLGCFAGVVTGQCHEISLRNQQFCNLSSVIVRPNDDLDDLLEKVETAAWLGVIQSSFTKFPYLRKKWKQNCEEERLLGISLSGQMDNVKLLTDDCLKALKSKAIKIAKKASNKMQINMPTAITCVKPEGTSSQVVYSGSGVHPWYSEYFIRRYRISANDPLCKLLEDQGVTLSPENGQTKENANTFVVSFPMKTPKGAITKDKVTAIEQLEWYKKIQVNWCEHNASATIYVKDNEWIEVGNWVYQNWNIVNGLSFLPYDGGKYQQAPLEEIDKEQYEKLLKQFPKIDYSQLVKYETEDNTEGAKNLACTGNQCEI